MRDLIPSRVVDALYGAVESAFATTAFLFAMPPMDDEEFEGMPAIVSVVHFDEPVRGYVAIRCPHSLLPVLTANMLGDETANSIEMQRDALGEITNVVCGNVLPELFPSARFVLRSPVVRESTDPEVAVVDPPTITLDIDGHRVDSILVIIDSGITE